MSVEAIIEGFLLNALSTQRAGLTVAPDGPQGPSVEWRTGFRAGQESGEVTGLITALSVFTGESPKFIAERLRFEADMAHDFPFTVHVDGVEAA